MPHLAPSTHTTHNRIMPLVVVLSILSLLDGVPILWGLRLGTIEEGQPPDAVAYRTRLRRIHVR
ncbi:hypothetical protein CEB3_c40740 [Peptococcaceae bacterium CEB3]|nr:hypothetical protein CEB3_c40740 [Peptococcaceae bacterium CEB3]